MTDIFEKSKRSAIMKNIRSKGNKSTELRLVEFFHKQGFKGWRRGYPIKGHPDFVFLEKRIAIFVDGCFWHGHDCRNTRPKENEDFWIKKIGRNIEHDKDINDMLAKRGWKVIRIWECELKKKNQYELIQKLSCLISD